MKLRGCKGQVNVSHTHRNTKIKDANAKNAARCCRWCAGRDVVVAVVAAASVAAFCVTSHSNDNIGTYNNNNSKHSSSNSETNNANNNNNFCGYYQDYNGSGKGNFLWPPNCRYTHEKNNRG